VLVVTRWKEISALRNRFSPHTQFLSEKSTTKGMCICPIESSGREKMNQQGEYSVQIFGDTQSCSRILILRERENDTGRDDRGFKPRKTFPIKI
jgi:hypothetical protein